MSSNSTATQLVDEIIAINKAWKATKELLGDTSLTRSYRNLKSRHQAKLLRDHAPEKVYLELDTTAESDEPLYSLKLTQVVGDRTDAAHLPVRVANELFSPEEPKKYLTK